MAENLSVTQQNIYNSYLAKTNATGGANDINSTVLIWGDDGSLTATEDDGDVFKFSADGTLVSMTEGENHKPAGAAGGTNEDKLVLNAKEKEEVIAELQEKYKGEGTLNGDPYSMANPQLKAFSQAMSDGLMNTLTKAGFSRNDIVDIISKVFPSIGINPTAKGGYTVPYGHDEESKKIYEEFSKAIPQTAGTSAEIEALKDKISGLQNQIDHYKTQINVLSAKIEKVKKEIEDNIKKAIEESEEIAEDQKKQAEAIIEEELNAYTSANGSMSYETFEGNITQRLNALDSSGQSKLAMVTMKLIQAESKMSLLNSYMGTMGQLINSSNDLETQIECNTKTMTCLEEELKKNPPESSDCERTDPIGFTADGKKFDFFLDKDGDQKLSNEQEFLGAEDGWSEMTALDTDGDGKVDKKELAAGDVKVVVTGKDGTQTVQNAADLFGEEDSVDLSSFKEMNQEMDNGNALLGTFGLTMGGNKVDTGYNTLDTLNWLDNNYTFSDKENGINRFAKGETQNTDNKTNDFTKILDKFKEDYKNLEKQLKDGWATININRDDISKVVNDAMKAEAEAEAMALNEEFKEYELNKDKK